MIVQVSSHPLAASWCLAAKEQIACHKEAQRAYYVCAVKLHGTGHPCAINLASSEAHTKEARSVK